MIRRFVLPAVLIVAAIGAALQAQRTDEAADPGRAPDAGPPEAVATTPMLSVRRTPEWLRQPLADSLLESEVRGAYLTNATPAQTCVVTHRDDQQIADIQGDMLFTPASAQKIMTAAAILELAPATETYRTEVVHRLDAEIIEPDPEAVEAALAAIAEGQEGVVVPGSLFAGDLWLIGNGDPILSTPEYIDRYEEDRPYTDFTELADAVAAELTELGVTEVSGGIIADESKYLPAERDYTEEFVTQEQSDENGDPVNVEIPIWKESFRTENQAGPLSALLLNDGYVSFPEDPLLRIENVRADDPAIAAADTLKLLLAERGIVVQGPSASDVAPLLSERNSIGEVESPPMADIVGRMLTFSDNTTAEMLLKEIGVRSGVGSLRGFAVFGMLNTLRDAGYETNGVQVADGSGLSSLNRTRCTLLVDILDRAGPESPIVLGLAVVGRSGTLRTCLESQSQYHDVAAKTGTLNDVTALSGTTIAENDDVITFSMMANQEGIGIELGTCNTIQTTLIRAVAGHPYGPDLADLSPLPASVG